MGDNVKTEVLLFAAARKHAGTDRVSVELPAAATVADLRRVLGDHVPALRSWTDQLMIALDQQYAHDQALIHPGMEVACFPPVSGG